MTSDEEITTTEYVSVQPEASAMVDDQDVSSYDDEGELHINERDKFVVMQPKDITVFQYKRWHEQGKLNLNPDWQREYVWKGKRPSQFIESLLMQIPIPVIFLAKTKDQRYEVIDGVQRLTTAFNFLENKFRLEHLSVYSELNGSYFKDLPEEARSKLEDSTIACFELSSQTSSDMLFTIFERINTGGMSLNEMEIRNCIYRGSLNDKIKELSRIKDFVNSVNLKNVSDRMLDRALILRFLAFNQNKYQNTSGGLKKFLNSFFQNYRNADDATLVDFANKFKSAMKSCYTVFGSDAFRVRRGQSAYGGEWAARPNASIFQVISTSFAQYDNRTITVNADAIYEEYLDLLTDQKWIDSVTKATGDYSNIKYSFETWNRRLDELINSAGKTKTKRLYSRNMKKQLFEQNSTCCICNQKIVSLDDAAVDHLVAYWRGGQTIPENARLTHRSCNQRKGGS